MASRSGGSALIIGDRTLAVALLALLVGVVGAYVAFGMGQEGGPRPGDAPGHLMGAAGALLMAGGLLYPLAKRTERLVAVRPWWYQAHLLMGAAGAGLAALHMAGRVGKAPTLVALAVLGLLVLGAYGRLLAARLGHDGFARDPLAFLPADPSRAWALHALADRKRLLAGRLEPQAVEGTFTPALRHWALHPVTSARLTGLSLQEERLVSRRRRLSAGPVLLLQRNWRLLHLILVALTGLGLLAHVIAVLLFAGYVAEGGEPYWWYLRK